MVAMSASRVIGNTGRMASAVPGVDFCPASSLFDHFVGEREQLVRKYEAQSLRSFQIEHQLEFCRLHNWQIARLLAVEDASDIDAGMTVGVGQSGRVAHQAAGHGVFPQTVNCGNRVACNERGELLGSAVEKWVVSNE